MDMYKTLKDVYVVIECGTDIIPVSFTSGGVSFYLTPSTSYFIHCKNGQKV